jgi:hypothetical protein
MGTFWRPAGAAEQQQLQQQDPHQQEQQQPPPPPRQLFGRNSGRSYKRLQEHAPPVLKVPKIGKTCRLHFSDEIFAFRNLQNVVNYNIFAF